MAFDPKKEGATELFDPAKEGAVALEEPQQPLEPNEAFERAGKVWDTSVDWQVPLRVIEDNYDYIQGIDVAEPGESPEMLEREIPKDIPMDRIEAVGPQRRPFIIPREKYGRWFRPEALDYLHKALETPVYIGTRYVSGRMLGADKLSWHILRKVNPALPQKSLNEALEEMSPYERTQVELLVGGGVEFIGQLQSARAALNAIGLKWVAGNGYLQRLANKAPVWMSRGAVDNLVKGIEQEKSFDEITKDMAKGILVGGAGAVAWSGVEWAGAKVLQKAWPFFLKKFPKLGIAIDKWAVKQAKKRAVKAAEAREAEYGERGAPISEESAEASWQYKQKVLRAIEKAKKGDTADLDAIKKTHGFGQAKTQKLLPAPKETGRQVRTQARTEAIQAWEKAKTGDKADWEAITTRHGFDETGIKEREIYKLKEGEKPISKAIREGLKAQGYSVEAIARLSPDEASALAEAKPKEKVDTSLLDEHGKLRTDITVEEGKITVPAKPVAKQPWEMTKEEWFDYKFNKLPKTVQTQIKNSEKGVASIEEIRRQTDNEHERDIQYYLAQGKPVPAEVLAEYPELAKPAPKIPPRPLVNPHATALQRDKQLRTQQAWDKKYGRRAPEIRAEKAAEGAKSRRREVLQARIKRGEPVGPKVLAEFESEPWAKEALTHPPAKPAASKSFENWLSQQPTRNRAAIKAYIQSGDTNKAISAYKEAGEGLYGGDRRAGLATKAAIEFAKGRSDYPLAKPTPERDLLGGVDPLQQIHTALKEATAVQPLTKAQKSEALRRRVAAAAGALKSNVKKGTPTEEAIFRSTGLLKGPLAEYDQLYTSIEDVLEPGAKEAAYAKISAHPGLQYFEVLNTAVSFKKLLAGAALTPTDVRNIENVFGKTFEDITEMRVVKSDLYDRIINLWKAGLLTGIKTTGLNTLANLSHAMSETAKDVPAALVDSITALFTGERALGFTAKGMLGGVKEGVKRGWKYLRTGYDERNIGAKLDYKTVHFGNGKIAKSLQAYEETIFHLLGAEDQPFYYGAKARSLFSQAIAEAKNKGLKGKERDAFVENLVKNPTNEMLIAAVHDAEVAVFQNKTSFGDVAKAVQKVKGGEVIVPFGRTPSAVAMQIVNYTPVGVVKEVAEQIHAGEFNQRKFSQAFGRAAVGTGALFVGTLLLRKGLITLDYPDTEKERELWKLEGRKANSIKIGDKWRSVHILGPVGNVLLIGGHFAQALKEKGSPTKAIVTALAGGAKSFSEQTFVRGVNMLVDALTSPERSFENWFSSMAGSLVPTIVADIANAQDDIGRRAVGPVQKVQARIPGARKGLEPRVDVFGQDLPRYGGNVLETMADPSRPAKIRHDVVVDELRRLFDKDIKVSPTLLGDKEGYDILTPEENTRLWRRAGELTYKALLALVNSKEYQNISDDFIKGNLIEPIVAKTKNVAKIELAMIKLKQGKTIEELGESGLLTVEGLEMLKHFQESKLMMKE